MAFAEKLQASQRSFWSLGKTPGGVGAVRSALSVSSNGRRCCRSRSAFRHPFIFYVGHLPAFALGAKYAPGY